MPEGIRTLRAAGFRPAMMTNGAATTEHPLDGAGVPKHFEAHPDIRGPCARKPAPAAVPAAARLRRDTTTHPTARVGFPCRRHQSPASGYTSAAC